MTEQKIELKMIRMSEVQSQDEVLGGITPKANKME